MKPKILIVEDEQEIVHLLCIRAEHRGFECLTDESGAHCLEKVQKWHPDLILMDLGLPELNGIELIMQLKMRAEFAGIPIIVYSSFGDKELVREAMHLGATGYFLKNGDMNDLLDMIEKHVQGDDMQSQDDFVGAST